MNILVGKDWAFVEKHDSQMANHLRSLDIEPVQCPLQNFQSLGGSFHCSSLDFRSPKQSSAQINSTNKSSTDLYISYDSVTDTVSTAQLSEFLKD